MSVQGFARDKEAYAVVSALDKWENWIGTNPLTVLTDHQALRHWVTEVSSCESGLSGRPARGHQKLSRFSLTVVWIRGVENGVADALSCFAYPASQTVLDVSWHCFAENDR